MANENTEEKEYKVGIKILTDDQLRNVMPAYNNLVKKIEACRAAACREHSKAVSKKQKRHYQYNLMYDNVFSILGQRGTGKTSVVFTLREQIEEKYASEYGDVVLPLIIPEVIPEGCSVIGWILAIIKEEIQKLDKELAKIKNEKYDYEDTWDRCRKGECFDEHTMTNKYDELTHMLYAGHYNPSSEASYYRAVGNSAKQAEDYYQFAQGIVELFDMWVDRIQVLRKDRQSEKTESCPMIYFIFDDVDLAPGRINELLSIIVKYLSHPNVIVITTCHEELVLEVIENRLDATIGRLPREWRDYLKNRGDNEMMTMPVVIEEESDRECRESREDLVGQTARMYLGKVFPASTRYYLQLFDTAKQKELFRITETSSLGADISGQIEQLIKCVGDAPAENFMCINNRIINIYLYFVGNTSRQISNVHIAIQELVDNLADAAKRKNNREIDREQLIVKIYQDIRYFLCVAIHANHELAGKIEQVDDFVDEIFLPEYNDWVLYCNYHYLNKYLRIRFENETAQGKIKVGLELYSLMIFVENLLVIMEKCMEKEITGKAKRSKVYAIVPLNGYIAHDVFERHFLFRTDLDPNKFFYNYMDLLNNLEAMAADKMSDARFNIEYFYSFRNNTNDCEENDVRNMYIRSPKWFKELVGMLTMVYGNVYLINKDDIEECLIYPDRNCLIGYQRRMDTDLREKLRNCFLKIEMHRVWKEDIKSVLDKMKFPSGHGIFPDFVENVRAALHNKEQEDPTWISFSQILDETIVEMHDWMYDNNKINCFPETIMRDLQNNRRGILERSDVTKELMHKYMDMILTTTAGQYVLLGDEEKVTTVLEDCSEQYLSMTLDIRKIQKQIDVSKNVGTSAVILDRHIYSNLAKLLANVLKKSIPRAAEEGYWSDKAKLIAMVREVFGDIDVVVERNGEDFKDAVRLCMQFVFVEGLQKIYLFQTVQEKYVRHSSRASAELEKSKGKDTYYYSVFQLLVKMMKRSSSKGSKTTDERMPGDIREAFSYARNNYFDSIIAEINNE